MKMKAKTRSDEQSTVAPSQNSTWDQRFPIIQVSGRVTGDEKLPNGRTVSTSLLADTARIRLQTSDTGICSLNNMVFPSRTPVTLLHSKNKKKKEPRQRQKEIKLVPEDYVDQPTELDVVSGRGGFSNHHPGNKRYRQVIKDMKSQYKSIANKFEKTCLSRSIVNYVYSYGGRFLRRVELCNCDVEKGHRDSHRPGESKTTITAATKKSSAVVRYYIMTPSEARRKTSQSLRENLEVKWTTIA